jgi:hypothetical protein
MSPRINLTFRKILPRTWRAPKKSVR